MINIFLHFTLIGNNLGGRLRKGSLHLGKQQLMKKINIVLVEPQIPQNTGNIARTCAVTGAVLHLVRPLGFEIDDKKLKRAGLDYWSSLDISYYDDLDDFFSKNSGQFYYFTTKGQKIYSDVTFQDNSYLVFGREDAGLPEKLLFENKNSCLRMPMRKGIRSLNLSNTVAIATYEVLRQWEFNSLEEMGQLTKFDWNDAE